MDARPAVCQVVRSMVKPGDELDERYRLLKRIGSGAHGVVFRARDLTSREEVAVKVLDPELARDGIFMERLRREAAALAQLRGTCAVAVHALRPWRSTAYMVMEHLVGRDFQEYLEAGEARGGRMKPAYLVDLLRPIAHTLDLARQNSLVHRDIKPSNIFILDKSVGRGVRLLDFGLVKMMDQVQITQQGQVAGTPSYIAPEVWQGRPEVLDHRVDVYGLGVVVFRALTGQVPHKSEGMVDMLRWAIQGKRPSLHRLRPDLDPKIDEWNQRALAVEPKDRFPDVVTLWSALEVALGTARRSPF